MASNWDFTRNKPSVKPLQSLTFQENNVKTPEELKLERKARREAIVAAYVAGRDISFLAKEFETTYTRVYDLVKNRGLLRVCLPPVPKEEFDYLQALLSKQSDSQAADLLSRLTKP